MSNKNGKGKTNIKGKSETRIISKGGLVTLRARVGVKGESLYLDYHYNGKRQYDFLSLYLIKPKTPYDKEQNKTALQIAESIKAKKEIALTSESHELIAKFKKNANLIEYFQKYVENYKKGDKRMYNGAFNKFKSFVGSEHLQFKNVTEGLLENFKNYLESELKGETPQNYFSRLKRVLDHAVKEKILSYNPALNIKVKRNSSFTKDVLTMDEIKVLSKVHCGNETIKRAFLFSCLTGLRFCDINELTWGHINGDIMKMKQRKTNKDVIINLNQSSITLLGKRSKPEDIIFHLPSSTACSKVLGNWVKRTKINKKVTWHVGRHSFATNLIMFDTDAKTVSSLLGHSGMHHVDKYIRVVKSLKEDAVKRLPSLDL